MTLDETGIRGRIVELRVERWGNRGRAHFAKEIGTGPSTYNYYERSRTPPVDVLVRVARVCGVELRWLLMGDGPKHQRTSLPAVDASDDPYSSLVHELRQLLADAPHLVGAVRGFIDTVRQVNRLGPLPGPPADAPLDTKRLIPVVGRTAAGEARFWSELPWGKEPDKAEAAVERVLRTARRQGQAPGLCAPSAGPQDANEPSSAVALVQLSVPDAEGVVEFLDSAAVRSRQPDAVAWRIDGDSMAPRFGDGDLVVTSPRRPAVADQPAVVRLKGQIGVTCKIHRREGRDVLLIPINETHEPLRVKATQVEWALQVLWRVRLTPPG